MLFVKETQLCYSRSFTPVITMMSFPRSSGYNGIIYDMPSNLTVEMEEAATIRSHRVHAFCARIVVITGIIIIFIIYIDDDKPASSRLAIRPECTDPVLGNN